MHLSKIFERITDSGCYFLLNTADFTEFGMFYDENIAGFGVE